jgi:hypothetical protein
MSSRSVSNKSNRYVLNGYFSWIFMVIEPLSTFAGWLGGFQPDLLLGSTAGDLLPLPRPVLQVVLQLANCYLLVGLMSAVVMRTTVESRVISALIAALLIGDIGHVGVSVYALGNDFWSPLKWSSVDLGNIPFTTFLAVNRVAYFISIQKPKAQRRGSPKKRR